MTGNKSLNRITVVGIGVIVVALLSFVFTEPVDPGLGRYSVEALSDDVSSLRPGDPVLLQGVASGEIISIHQLKTPQEVQVQRLSESATPRQVALTSRIVMEMNVDTVPLLRTDYKIRIEGRGLLGGKLIRIDTGSANDSADLGKELLALSST